MTHANRLRLDRYGYSHRIAQQRLDAADYIDALEAELARYVPVQSPFEVFTTSNGFRGMRPRDDLYERK